MEFHAIILISFINRCLVISKLKSHVLIAKLSLSITFLFLILDGGNDFKLTTVFNESEQKIDSIRTKKEVVVNMERTKHLQ